MRIRLLISIRLLICALHLTLLVFSYAFILSFLYGDADFCRNCMKIKFVLDNQFYVHAWYKDDVKEQAKICDIDMVLGSPEFGEWVKQRAIDGDQLCIVILSEGYEHGLFGLPNDKNMARLVSTLLGYDKACEQWYPSLMANDIEDTHLLACRWNKLSNKQDMRLSWSRMDVLMMRIQSFLCSIDEFLLLGMLTLCCVVSLIPIWKSNNGKRYDQVGRL